MANARAVFLLGGFTLLCLLGVGPGEALSAPWNEISGTKCSELYDAQGSPWGPKTAVMFTWLAGYRDGIGALASFDKRLSVIGKTDLSEAGTSVLAICKSKPDMTVAEVTTSVFAFYINALPGRRIIELALPHAP